MYGPFLLAIIFFVSFTINPVHAQQNTASSSATPRITATPASTIGTSPTGTPIAHSPSIRPSPTPTSLPSATPTLSQTQLSPTAQQDANTTIVAPTPSTPLPSPTPTNMIFQTIQEELPTIISFLRPPRGMILHQNITDNYYPETTLPINKSIALITAGFVCVIHGLLLLSHL